MKGSGVIAETKHARDGHVLPVGELAARGAEEPY